MPSNDPKDPKDPKWDEVDEPLLPLPYPALPYHLSPPPASDDEAWF